MLTKTLIFSSASVFLLISEMLRILSANLRPSLNFAGRIRFCSQVKLPELFDKDGNLLPLDDKMDYFQLFGLERHFNIEITDLSNTFKSLQRNLHPDKVSLVEIFRRTFVSDQVLFSSLSPPPSRIKPTQRAGRQPLTRDTGSFRNLSVELSTF